MRRKFLSCNWFLLESLPSTSPTAPANTGHYSNSVYFLGQRRRRSANIKTAFDECLVFKLHYDTEHILLYKRVWNLQSGNGFYLMVVCHQRKLKEQSLQKEFWKRVNSGCREGCSRGGRISQISTILYNDVLFCIGQTCRNCDSSNAWNAKIALFTGDKFVNLTNLNLHFWWESSS